MKGKTRCTAERKKKKNSDITEIKILFHLILKMVKEPFGLLAASILRTSYFYFLPNCLAADLGDTTAAKWTMFSTLLLKSFFKII